jgi:hypothetical protein
MGCDLIERLKEAHPVSPLCDVPGVRRSRYYARKVCQPSARRVHMQAQAKAIHAETRQTFRHAACRSALRAKGLDMGRHCC